MSRQLQLEFRFLLFNTDAFRSAVQVNIHHIFIDFDSQVNFMENFMLSCAILN